MYNIYLKVYVAWCQIQRGGLKLAISWSPILSVWKTRDDMCSVCKTTFLQTCNTRFLFCPAQIRPPTVSLNMSSPLLWPFFAFCREWMWLNIIDFPALLSRFGGVFLLFLLLLQKQIRCPPGQLTTKELTAKAECWVGLKGPPQPGMEAGGEMAETHLLWVTHFLQLLSSHWGPLGSPAVLTQNGWRLPLG